MTMVMTKRVILNNLQKKKACRQTKSLETRKVIRFIRFRDMQTKKKIAIHISGGKVWLAHITLLGQPNVCAITGHEDLQESMTRDREYKIRLNLH